MGEYGKQVDYGLKNTSMIEKIDACEVPTSEQISDQMVEQLVCMTCLYYEQCNMVSCMDEEQERILRFEEFKRIYRGFWGI